MLLLSEPRVNKKGCKYKYHFKVEKINEMAPKLGPRRTQWWIDEETRNIMTDKEAKDHLERLKAIRAANRGVMTKKIANVNEILGGGGVLNDDYVRELNVLDRLLEKKLKTGEERDQNVLSLCELEAIQHEIEESEKVLEKVVDCQKCFQEALDRGNDELTVQDVQANSGDSVQVFINLCNLTQCKGRQNCQN